MLLVDAIYIHNGGGKVLLDYLIDCLENTNLKVYYLLDDRIINKKYIIKRDNHMKFMSPSFLKRYRFYKNNKSSFSKIFVLGNVPPSIRTKAVVYTYFHSTLYIKPPTDYSFLERIIYGIKTKIVKYISKNTDFWLVQTHIFKQLFIEKFNKTNVEIVPFFPELLPNSNSETHQIRQKGVFLYVSNANTHKNHIRLLKAFCLAYDILEKGKLIITVNEDYPHVIGEIRKKQNEGYPIENIGFVDRHTLIKVYQKAEYVIFPSLTESFGLGLIEGISLGCKVIGADLPYTYAVCEPSLTFNPSDVTSITNAIQKSLNTDLPISKVKIYNQKEELIAMLQNNLKV
ncbi:glycosyltransferase [Capnocytophaga stomatis]|uniref:glycosyltransferase n=1 Tax=Capnocytophaga stomatis TaxID=1848904 RepID=UPI00385DFC3A